MHSLLICLTLCFSFGAAVATEKEKLPGPKLGKAATQVEIDALNIDIFPDGNGLPVGKGNALVGEKIYEKHCIGCHGPKGIGGSAEELAGAEHLFNGEYADKTIGTYWPYATTLFDFIRRAMPLDSPRVLSHSQVYAVTAYLLYVNGIIDEKTKLNADNLATIEMPNRDGFIQIRD